MNYIQKIPNSHRYRILRWCKEDARITAPLIGFVVKDMVVSSRRDPISEVSWASAGVACDGVDTAELFALKILQTSSVLNKVSKTDNILIFRKRYTPSTGSVILATLNGVQRLFKINFSPKETILLPESGIPIHLSPKDLFVIDGIKMSAFSNAEN